ncbi:hypothetical protein ABH937_003809 [Kitasatospora sp. GAS1066B]
MTEKPFFTFTVRKQDETGEWAEVKREEVASGEDRTCVPR